jgi:hypothetical protein
MAFNNKDRVWWTLPAAAAAAVLVAGCQPDYESADSHSQGFHAAAGPGSRIKSHGVVIKNAPCSMDGGSFAGGRRSQIDSNGVDITYQDCPPPVAAPVPPPAPPVTINNYIQQAPAAPAPRPEAPAPRAPEVIVKDRVITHVQTEYVPFPVPVQGGMAQGGGFNSGGTIMIDRSRGDLVLAPQMNFGGNTRVTTNVHPGFQGGVPQGIPQGLPNHRFPFNPTDPRYGHVKSQPGTVYNLPPGERSRGVDPRGYYGSGETAYRNAPLPQGWQTDEQWRAQGAHPADSRYRTGY